MKAGCIGFPVGRDRYWSALSFVETRTGAAMPRPATLSEWRAGAPAGAEFAVQAYRLITHGPDDRGFPAAGKKLPPLRRVRCGAFREGLECHEAWMSTKTAAELLDARIVVFETPASFQPGADSLRDMHRFFKGLARGRLSLVWHPRAPSWDEARTERVCGDLGLILSFDPLGRPAPRRGAFLYLRPAGPRSGGLGEDNLSSIRRAAQGRPAYVALGHRDAFRDAERLKIS